MSDIPSQVDAPNRPLLARTAWVARAALVIATMFIIANALVAFTTSSKVTEAEASVVDSQAIRLELAALLAKHATFEPGELEEHLDRLGRLTAGDAANQKDLTEVRALVRAGAPYSDLRLVVSRMNAREESSLVAREAELHTARRIDASTTLASLFVGLAFVGSLAVLLSRRARTDRRAAEVLRASEERMRLFIEHAPASLAMFDREMRYLSASRHWIKDYEQEEGAAKGLSLYESMPDLELSWRKIHKRALAGEVMRSDLDLITRDDQDYWIKWEIRPWYEAPGEIGGVIAIVEDVTERKKTEEARDRAVEQARHADRLATVGRLAAGVAHEIGTPLSVATGYAEMIATNEVKVDQAPKSAQIIIKQLERVTRIVRQLLDFSRRRAPSGETELVDIGRVVRRTIELLKSTGGKRAIVLEATTPSAGTRVLGSEEAITQLVTNLLMNAIHASQDGGVVHAGIERLADELRLTIRDQGTGMTDEVREHIFDPFFTTKAIGDGTGLGLSVVHGIVQDHHGQIEVDTAPGKGTTFTVTFPRAEQRDGVEDLGNERDSLGRDSLSRG